MSILQSAFAAVIAGVMGASFLYGQTPARPTPGTISGVVLDVSGKPYAGAQIWTMEVGPHQFRHWEDSYATDAQGRFRLTVVPGAYYVCAFPPGVSLDETKMAMPACFPSAPAYSLATAVTVEPHGASPQLTIRLLEMPTYSIGGRITSGRVPRTRHWVMAIDAESDHPEEERLGCGRLYNVPYSSACATGFSGDVKANGSFVISGVPAGSYRLRAVSGDGVGNEIIATDSVSLAQPTPAPPIYTGERNVTVKGNLSGVSVKVKLQVNDKARQR
jgi:hypothetical protein